VKKTFERREKRKHPRLPISFPVGFQIDGKEMAHSGVTLDISESGLLIQTFKDMPVGTKLKIEFLFPKDFELPNFRGVAEIIWKDIYYWEDWEGYQYGLKLTQISNKDYLVLKRLLSDPSFLKEAHIIDKAKHDSIVIVKIKNGV